MNNIELITLSKEEFYLLKPLYDNKQCPLKNYIMEKRLWFTNRNTNNYNLYSSYCPNCFLNNYDKLNLDIDEFTPILSKNNRFNCDFAKPIDQIEKSINIDTELFLSAFTNDNGYLEIKKSNNNDNNNDNGLDEENNNTNIQYDIFPKSSENIILCLYKHIYLNNSLYIKIYNIKEEHHKDDYSFLEAKKTINFELICSLNNECLNYNKISSIINKFTPNNIYILEYRNILNDPNSSKKIIINIKNID